ILVGTIGAGKTRLASEFGDWYQSTGGASHLFEGSARDPPSALLARLESALSEAQRCNAAASEPQHGDISEPDRDPGLRHRTASAGAADQLWIIDDAEYIDGYPIKFTTAWRQPDKRQLLKLLGAAVKANVKFLLTSRRPVLSWLSLRTEFVTLGPLRPD